MIYLITKSYSPNTAPINRVMGWVHGLSDLSEPTEVVFFSPTSNFDKVNESYPHIKFTYMWDRWYINHSTLKYLSLFLYTFIFLSRLKKGDKVYMYGMAEMLPYLIRKRGVEFYYEETECPEVVLSGTRFFNTNVDKFIKNCKRLTGLFVISENLKEYFRCKGIDDSKIHVVNMTVDTSRFDGVEKQQSKRYIAYCGNASNNKDGVDQLIKAFAITSKTSPDVKLYIIGPRPSEGCSFPNQELAEELGITDKVVFTGMVKSEDMPQLLKNAEILALDRPDNIQAKYGFPTKLGEYLLTGNPVVITRVGNIPLFLQDGISALISNPDNPEAFAAKLNWALENPLEAQVIGNKGREVALNEFNYRTESTKLISILNPERL